MPPRNSRTAHPAVSQQIEQMLRARSIEFDFEPNAGGLKYAHSAPRLGALKLRSAQNAVVIKITPHHTPAELHSSLRAMAGPSWF